MADKTPAALQAEIDRLTAENAALKNKPAQALSLKVGDKGGVSVYGLGRFPVTLYGSQWTRLLDAAPQIKAFMAENASKLTVKS